MANQLPISFERTWTMPNRYTFAMPPVIALLDEEVTGVWADPFCGEYGHIWAAGLCNDIDDSKPATYHEDGLAFLKLQRASTLEGCLFDPPYSPEQARRCYKARYEGIAGLTEYHAACKDEIMRILKPGGKAICFGWNSCGLGKSRGFTLVRGLLLCHGQRHDTIITVEVKN